LRSRVECPSCRAVLELDLVVVNPSPLGKITRRSSAGRWGLTRREAEIADLIVDGYPNRDIAEQLKISYQTVKNYCHRIMQKVGAGSRSELVSMVLLSTGAEAQE
jgi:DNA-binding CsgD family transcriptional regulator